MSSGRNFSATLRPRRVSRLRTPRPSAATEFFEDAVMRDGTADGRGGVRHGEVDSTRAGRGRQTGGGALVGAADQTISRKLPAWLKVTTNLEKKPFWPRRPSPTSLRCRKSPRKGRIRKRSEEAYQKCGPLRERYRNMRSGADSKYLRRHKHSDWESHFKGPCLSKPEKDAHLPPNLRSQVHSLFYSQAGGSAARAGAKCSFVSERRQ